jgi:uncharacterized protein YjbI with pentapeptide repeats
VTDPAPTFCGKYVISMYWLGWLTVGSGGNLAFVTEAFPLDGSGFFNCYELANGAIALQAAATGQYLALAAGGVILANAATTAAALQLAVLPNENQLNSAMLVGANPFGIIHGTDAATGPPVLFAASPPSPYFLQFSMMCVVPGAPIPPPPSGLRDVAAKMDRAPRRPRAAAVTRAQRSPQTPAPGAALGAALGASSPPFPYFCGKYSLAYYEGWVHASANAGVGVTPLAFPADGSGLFVCYAQPPSNLNYFFTGMPTVSWQTTPGPGHFLAMPPAGDTAIIVNSTVPSVAQAPAFGYFPSGAPGSNMIVCPVTNPNLGWYIATGSGDTNPVLSITNNVELIEGTLVTRLVAGLQDVLAPGASNWWDGADLSYVDMTTCAGFLTGPAAQWGNADFTGAILTKIDLSQISIGNAVNFTDATLAGVKFKSGQDLSQATLRGADLSGGVDLSAVKLGSPDLTGTNLANAILTGVDLSGATCVGTNFTATDLRTTKLPTATGMLGQGSTGAIFAGATVPIASLGTDWRNINLSATTLLPLSATITALRADNAKFQGTILDGLTCATDGNGHGASFQSADLTNASLQGVAAESAIFSSAVLYAADLTNADLTSTTWSNAFAGSKQQLFTLSPFGTDDVKSLNSGNVPADLTSAFAANGHPLQSPQVKVRSNSSAWLISDTSNAYSVIRTANALNVLTTGRTSAKFAGAILANANLTGGSFAGVHFQGVQVTGAANASGVDFEQADFSNANISSGTSNQPNLQGAYLYGANLDGAFLFNVNLAGAYLSPSTASAPATMSGAMLAGATLTGANLDGTDMTGAFIGLQPQGAPSADYGYVPLFTLDATTFTPILNNGANWGTSAPAALQQAFASNGISLSGPAIFTAYPGQALWGISLTDANLDPPPTPATAGWVWTTFMIMQGNPRYQGTSDLVVYGTMFWMFAPDNTRALQPEPYFAALTTITQNDLTPTTYCPNSRTWATNLANNVPWEAVMMPASQPVSGSTSAGAPPLHASPPAEA